MLDTIYAYLNKVIVVEVTSTIRGIPQEVPLGRKEGLQHPSVANMDNLRVIPKSLLGDAIGMVGSGREAEIECALGTRLTGPSLKLECDL